MSQAATEVQLTVYIHGHDGMSKLYRVRCHVSPIYVPSRRVAGKPLVSGAAIGTEGQLTVYNHGQDVQSKLDLFVRHISLLYHYALPSCW